jgi:hypothetical protein
MSIVASFTFGQSAEFPNICEAVDTSSGTYGSITQRRIYVSDCTGTYLTGDGSVQYTEWPLADLSIQLDILSEDTAVSVRVDWLDVSNVVVESVTEQFPCSEFNRQFFYYLLESQGLTPGIYQDLSYVQNLVSLFAGIVGGDEAVERYNDISNAQNCYNRATALRQNQALAF